VGQTLKQMISGLTGNR